MNKLLTCISSSATALSCSKSKVYELIHSGDLDVVKLGRRTLVTVKSLEALAAKHGSIS